MGRTHRKSGKAWRVDVTSGNLAGRMMMMSSNKIIRTPVDGLPCQFSCSGDMIYINYPVDGSKMNIVLFSGMDVTIMGRRFKVTLE